MNATLFINIFTAVTVFALGLLIAVGVFGAGINGTTRIIFGVLFMSYGVYRFLNVQTKRKLLKQEETREKMREERERLFRNDK